jgi:hypothetical protein
VECAQYRPRWCWSAGRADRAVAMLLPRSATGRPPVAAQRCARSSHG